MRQKFSWQSGFGAFSVSHSQINKVAIYIINQERHHSKKTFRQEYVEFLNGNDIDFNDEYIFD